MTDFFKNNQIALRHCLLYEFLQGKCAEKAFVDFSKTVGEYVMNKKEIQVWFRRFAKGKFYKNSKKHDQVTVKDIIQSDKKALRTCILYLSMQSQKKAEENPDEVPKNWREKQNLLRFNPSFVMYEKFRKVIREDVMEYREFDFWFHRFLNGKYDMNFERDDNTKIYELLDMPIDIMKNIVEYLDIYDRMKLSKTSRSFKEFVEEQKLSFWVVEITAGYGAHINIDNETVIKYVEKEDDYIMRFRKNKKIIKGVPYWKKALIDFNNFLKTSNLKVDLLRISWGMDKTFYQPPTIHVSEISWDFTHQLNVREFEIQSRNLEPLLTILPSLKPGYLESIGVGTWSPDEEGWEKLVESEQWKQAKHFHHLGNPLDIPIRHFHHFRSFDAFVRRASVEEVRQLKEVLFTSPVFESCLISIRNFIDSFDERTLDELFGDPIETTPNRTYHYPIPHSTQYFEIKIDDIDILFERMTISR